MVGVSMNMNSMTVRSLCLVSCLMMMMMMMMMQLCFATARMSIIYVEDHQLQVHGAEKVKLDLYYESLCPYSARFIVKGLEPIFKNGLIDIVDLKFFPWGNAKLTSKTSFVCQHGASECLLNTVEACAIDIWPSLSQHFPFIFCVENLALEGKYTEWQTCFNKLGLDSKRVKECNSNGQGNKLELKYAAETAKLNPPHEYVPWVVVNGQPLHEDYENFTSYVCKAYKGTPPKACSGVLTGSLLREATFPSHPVTYADEALTMVLSKIEANYVA